MDINIIDKHHYDFDKPPILYKYRSWRELFCQKILRENSIFFAAPDSFEDEKDCNILELFPESQEDLISLFFAKSQELNPNFTHQQHMDFATMWSRKSPLANFKERDKYVKYFKELFYKTFGVLSLTANSSNETMWDKYGDSHKGICIGFDTNKLFPIADGGGFVKYVDHLPVIDFSNDDNMTQFMKNTYFKELCWSSEEEYRLHKRWIQNVSLNERNHTLLDDCIVEVILGKNISNAHRLEIENIIQTKNIKLI